MTDHAVPRSEVVARVANRVWRHRAWDQYIPPEPDPLDFMEAEKIVDEVLSWRA